MTTVEQLEAALAATAAALDAGDPIVAAEASGRAAAACQALAAAGQPLTPDQLDRARALQASCEAAAERVQRRLVVEVAQSARSRRAATAYGDQG